MEFRNLTPFPALAYQALDQYNNLYHVVVARQTLTIHGNGGLTYPDEQAPLVVADEYFDEINHSSVRQESDLAPYKPKCDVVIVASAYSPNGRPVPRISVRVRILTPVRSDDQSAGVNDGKVVLDKSLIVTGPRFWKKSSSREWTLTEPEPISKLPLRYEYAFGGELKVLDVEGQRTAAQRGEDPLTVPPLRHSVAETNSVGRGYTERWYIEAERPDQIPAPQIEDPVDPVREFGKHYSAQGIGVITKVWLPRRALCGTIDDQFAKSQRWLPEDFNFGYWNGAHPNFQIPFPQGDEIIELTNLTPDGILRICLPGHRSYALVRFETGEVVPAPMNLDTLLVDLERKSVSIITRIMLSAQPEIRVLEACLVTRDQWQEATHSTVITPELSTLTGVPGGR